MILIATPGAADLNGDNYKLVLQILQQIYNIRCEAQIYILQMQRADALEYRGGGGQVLVQTNPRMLEYYVGPGVANGKILKYNGSAWVVADDGTLQGYVH